MPRNPRLFLAGVPCHIVIRGHNRDACFCSEQDFHVYLRYLYEACEKYDVYLHAFVLMTNHVHLLLSPKDELSGSHVMGLVSGRYARYFNHKYRRSGSLWEGRFKSSLIFCEQYLLEVYRYIELNPVRAKMVDHPRDYPWSSYHTNARNTLNPHLSPHVVYLALGVTTRERTRAYRELCNIGIKSSRVKLIRHAVVFSSSLGTSKTEDHPRTNS